MERILVHGSGESRRRRGQYDESRHGRGRARRAAASPAAPCHQSAARLRARSRARCMQRDIGPRKLFFRPALVDVDPLGAHRRPCRGHRWSGRNCEGTAAPEMTPLPGATVWQLSLGGGAGDPGPGRVRVPEHDGIAPGATYRLRMPGNLYPDTPNSHLAVQLTVSGDIWWIFEQGFVAQGPSYLREAAGIRVMELDVIPYGPCRPARRATQARLRPTSPWPLSRGTRSP